MRRCQLFLMRHGIAIDRDDPECPPDPDRALTEKGRERTRQVAKTLRCWGVEPTSLWTSPYLRARQTAEIVADVLGPSRRDVEEVRYLEPAATAPGFFGRLTTAGVDSLIAFGHSPNLDDLVRHAVAAPRLITRLKKAGVIALELDDWEPGTGTIQWVLTPKIVKALGD